MENQQSIKILNYLCHSFRAHTCKDYLLGPHSPTRRNCYFFLLPFFPRVIIFLFMCGILVFIFPSLGGNKRYHGDYGTLLRRGAHACQVNDPLLGKTTPFVDMRNPNPFCRCCHTIPGKNSKRMRRRVAPGRHPGAALSATRAACRA